MSNPLELLAALLDALSLSGKRGERSASSQMDRAGSKAAVVIWIIILAAIVLAVGKACVG